MASKTRCGQIVWVEIADANGIRKERPALIITPDNQMAEAESLTVVAITSQVPEPLPDDYVLLPWHAQGHPRTGLNRKCAAVCSWLRQIDAKDILNVAGITPAQTLAEIASKLPAQS